MAGSRPNQSWFARLLAWMGLSRHGWAAAVLRHERVLALLILAAIGAWAVFGAETPVIRQAALGFCGLGFGLWLFARWRLGRIMDPEESGARLGAPLYAAAPALPPSKLRQLPPDRRTASDYVLERPDSEYAAVYRRLGGVASRRMSTASPVVAITAPRMLDGGPGEALALARTMAAQGKKVIIIDCDVRLRALTRVAGLGAPEAGVWEVLDGTVSWRDARLTDSRSHAHVLAAAGGARDHRELFDSPAFSALLTELGAVYDVVVLSCPSALGPAVTPVIARHATMCVLVVRWAKSPAHYVRAALRALNRFRSGPKPGLLLTDAPQAKQFQRHMRPIG